MAHFPLRNGHQSITLVCEVISVWKGRSRVILSKGDEYPSQNENIFTSELVQMFGAATKTNKFCIEYRQVPHVFGKTLFGRRIDIPVILDFRGRIYPK